MACGLIEPSIVVDLDYRQCVMGASTYEYSALVRLRTKSPEMEEPMKIYAWLAIVLTIIGAALGIKRSIVANERRKSEIKNLKDEKETAERMDDVEIGDSHLASEFLRKRIKDRDL